MKKNNETVTKLRTGDEVVVIAGKDIGKKGTVQKISKFNNKAVITGINMIKKHTKPNPQLGEVGGIVEKEAAMNLSNVAIWNPKQKKADRISFQTDGDKKLRVYSSDRDKEILVFFCLNIFLIFFLVSPLRLIYGLPDLLFKTVISLKLIPFEIPVPSAFEKASFAANLLA